MAVPEDEALDAEGPAPAGDPPGTQWPTLPGPISVRRIQDLLTYEGPAVDVQGPIARGANGEVLLARQVSLDRDVAVKIPRRGDASAVGSVVQEAYVAAHLDHPNIVPIHDIWSMRDGPAS